MNNLKSNCTKSYAKIHHFETRTLHDCVKIKHYHLKFNQKFVYLSCTNIWGVWENVIPRATEGIILMSTEINLKYCAHVVATCGY